ncbi:hypothetical protein [Streptomyces sp. NPDC059466]|uniref:hypothetical protein n=1 Tax=unclassified Streptomyces TaxID=2593676 RepID=UPI0036862E95
MVTRRHSRRHDGATGIGPYEEGEHAAEHAAPAVPAVPGPTEFSGGHLPGIRPAVPALVRQAVEQGRCVRPPHPSAG